jgi:MarR family transcriptional regulator, negative regulator of the multidrug operon emrRAB
MLSSDERTANLLGALALEAASVQERAAEGAVGQSGAAAGALVTIAAHPNRTIEELRAPLGLSQPGAARLVQRLVDAGWVDRSGPGGRGGHRLTVTTAARELLDQLFDARRAALLELLAPLDDSERRSLAAMLERMLAAGTTDVVSAKHLCRLCERRTCARCPVGTAAQEST